MKRHLCLTSILLCLCACIYAQDIDSTLQKITDFPNRLFSKIKTKAARLDKQLDRQNEKYLQKLANNEAKLQRKLSRVDSNAAKNLFVGSQEKYQQYIKQIKTFKNKGDGSISGEYLPYTDSIKGSLSFLEKNKELFHSSAVQNQIASSLSGFNQLQAKLQQTEQIKQFI
ncbi:MAG TPA: hypothetical protein VNX68_05400, partial [Nitrosopumilaceae archaeon]|nr:hypothetical protein [Nitrosopumilaceae archaeon]